MAIKIPHGDLLEDTESIKVCIFHATQHVADFWKNFLREVHSWSKLDHKNILPLTGFTTDFKFTVSIVSPWMEKGNARKFVCEKSNDPRPLVRQWVFETNVI